jgi:dTDP-4-dehydrorhamnose reductase
MTMRWLITGLGGTLAPVVAEVARKAGAEVVGWDRAQADPADSKACAAWLRACRADAIAHLAMGPPAWAAQLAGHAAEQSLPFVFTSTAMVFHHRPDGPHAVGDPRTARDDYGRYKIACEDAVLGACPGASVVRIGWQIDPVRTGNNMLLTLDEWQRRDGCVAASRAWRPACSFMADTAAALVGLLCRPQPGVVHVDSNAEQGDSFDRIVAALKTAFRRDHWLLRVNDDYRHDQRLAGGGSLVPPLAARLPLLAGPV